MRVNELVSAVLRSQSISWSRCLHVVIAESG